MPSKAAIAAAAALLGLAACGAQAPSSTAPAKSAAPQADHHGGHHRSAAVPHRGGHRGTVVHGLQAIHDPGRVTGTLTGPCRALDHGLLPDPSCTPGAIDPAVAQANIGSTICRTGYTDSVRPPPAGQNAIATSPRMRLPMFLVA